MGYFVKDVNPSSTTVNMESTFAETHKAILSLVNIGSLTKEPGVPLLLSSRHCLTRLLHFKVNMYP